MGVRADMTPQAARIDAHTLAEEGITRLCYVGHVLHYPSQAHVDRPYAYSGRLRTVWQQF